MPEGQPADLPTDFGDQAGRQQAMGNRRPEAAGLGETRIEMHGVVVAGNGWRSVEYLPH